MGGKLSKKKKGCYGDHTDEAADEPSETPIDQKDEETNGKRGLDCTETLKGEQPDSNGLQSEEKSKNVLQGGEIVNQVKEATEASKDQTKDGQRSPEGEDLKSEQTKGAESEMEKANGERIHSKPDVSSTASVESNQEETKPAIVHQSKPEICSNNAQENKAKEVSANIQSANVANKNPTECITHSDENVNGAVEPLCSLPTENICNAQSVKEKDPVRLNAANLLKNSACSKPLSADIPCQDTSPGALQESSKKDNSEGDHIDALLLKSSDEAHPVSCEDTISKQSLDDGNAIDNHERVASVRSNSDHLENSTEPHKEESYNCELLNPAQETKQEESASKPTECLNTDDCGVKLETCTTPGKDICVTAGDECLAQKHQRVPMDQTTCISETKPDPSSAPKLEESSSLKGSLRSSKPETQAETEHVDEAPVAESEAILSQTELTSAAVQRASLDPTEMKTAVIETSTSPVEAETAEMQTSVMQMQSTSEVETFVTQMEVKATAELETCVTPLGEESITEPEASVAPVEEVSLVESLATPAPVGKISSPGLETCMAPAKATPPGDSVALNMLSSSSEREVDALEEASPEKVVVEEVQAAMAFPVEMEKSVVETEVSPAKLEDRTAQREAVTPVEPEKDSTQREAASQEEPGEGTVSEEAAYRCKEGNVAEMHIQSPAEGQGCAVNGEGTSPPEIDASLTLEHMTSKINDQICESPAKLDCPPEPEISAVPIEHEEHETTESIPDMAKVEEHETPVTTASSDPDASKDLADVITINHSDSYNARENQEGQRSGEGQESKEEKYPEETDSKLCPETVQELEINVENIKEKEVQNAVDLKIEVSSEYVIHDAVPQNSELVVNGES